MINFSLHEILNSGHDHIRQNSCCKNILNCFGFGRPPAHGPNLAPNSNSSESWQISPMWVWACQELLQPSVWFYCWDYSIWGRVCEGLMRYCGELWSVDFKMQTGSRVGFRWLPLRWHNIGEYQLTLDFLLFGNHTASPLSLILPSSSPSTFLALFQAHRRPSGNNCWWSRRVMFPSPIFFITLCVSLDLLLPLCPIFFFSCHFPCFNEQNIELKHILIKIILVQ